MLLFRRSRYAAAAIFLPDEPYRIRFHCNRRYACLLLLYAIITLRHCRHAAATPLPRRPAFA